MKNTFVLLLVGLLFSCNSPSPSVYDHIPDSEAQELLKKGIEASGGLDAWHALGQHSFKKDAILYLEDGSIEAENLDQTVTFDNFPNLSGTILSGPDSLRNEINFDNEKATKKVNNIAGTDSDNEAARLSFLGAHIVMSMPFKLLDPGVKLTYGGKATQYNKNVEILIADYNADEPNHTKTHRWWHYFDGKDYSYLGYKVYHPPTYALIENKSTTTFKGIAFPLERTTWRVDENDKKEYVRGKFSYSDFR